MHKITCTGYYSIAAYDIHYIYTDIPFLSLLQACPIASQQCFQMGSNCIGVIQNCGSCMSRTLFSCSSSVIGRPGYSLSPATVQRARILSPKKASLDSFTASVESFAVLHKWWLEQITDSTLFSPVVSISLESRIVLPILGLFLTGSGVGQDTWPVLVLAEFKVGSKNCILRDTGANCL